jgi:hypothetical protein
MNSYISKPEHRSAWEMLTLTLRMLTGKGKRNRQEQGQFPPSAFNLRCYYDHPCSHQQRQEPRKLAVVVVARMLHGALFIDPLSLFVCLS